MWQTIGHVRVKKTQTVTGTLWLSHDEQGTLHWALTRPHTLPCTMQFMSNLSDILRKLSPGSEVIPS